MKSFGILRTNTGLTSNIKIIIDSNYNFYLESIDSSPELSSTKLKKVQFNKDNFYDELIPSFYKDFPVDIAFSIKYDEDNYNMSNDFSNQYDDFYCAGARNITNNKDYLEEYEYFAPLYLFKHHIPKYFIIFRVDGPGIINLNKDNFKSEFLSKMKVVKIFDLTRNTQLGEWIDKSFRNNINYPKAPLEVDFRSLEFTKWYGIDYESGGYTNKPFFLDENLENENTLFDFEKFFLDGYKTNKIIFPNILNLNFLFDDTPATPTSIRKWSLNRYSGFYIDDLDLIETITPYNMPRLQSDVVITNGNFIESPNFGDPFVDGFKEEVTWVEYLGNFYLVIKVDETGTKSVNVVSKDKFKKVNIEEVTNPTITRYKIISELNLTGKELDLNKRSYFINELNQIVDTLGNPLVINDIEFADINIIEINGTYHNVFLQNGFLTLNTDYGFKFTENNLFSYFINSGQDGNEFTWDLRITKSNIPKNFKIFRVKFSDIKDFDTHIIDSELSKFEYEIRNKLTKTDESKMYLTDLRSQSSPQDFDDFILDGKRELVPVSSDYTANLETFRIEGNKLSDIWRKNTVFCRWGYQNSLSSHDYPYLLNNSILHEEFNRTVNTVNSIPNRSDRNLDYFYTFNSGTTSYIHHSLHVERNFEDEQDSSFRFELDKYLELGTYSIDGLTYSYDFDYFDLILSKKTSHLDGKILLNKEKFSYLEQGDSVEPNTTLFRGLKFRLFEVDNIKFNQTNIENVNLFTSNKFGDYKFSIILSSNDYMIGDNGQLYKPYNWDWYVKKQNEFGNLSLLTTYSGTPSSPAVGDIIEIDQFYPYINSDYGKTTSNVLSVGSLNLGGYGIKTDKIYTDVNDFEVPGIWRNKMQWKIIKNWQYDEEYKSGDIVFYGGVIFDVIGDSIINDPNFSPVTDPNYSVNTTLLQFWNPIISYTNNSWIYKDGEYYYYDSTGLIDFWNPLSNYIPGNFSLYNGIFFESKTFSQDINPIISDKKVQSSNEIKYWERVSGTFSALSKWKKIELWDRFKDYNSEFVVKDDILYSSTQPTTPSDIPGESNLWIREYSFVPDSNFNYGTSSNSVININQSFYYCIYNPGLTLDSGITVYINKKWKNILVNITINDNTIDSSVQIMDETRNIERDSLYVETNGRLTAANFIRQLNDLDSLYGFADYTSYVVIEEDGSFNKFNFKSNLENLPYILFAEESDEFQLKRNSLKFEQRTLGKSVLNYSRYLNNGNIDNLEKLNYYNLTPLAVEISNIRSDENILKNLNGQKREIFEKLRRHSGYYMPIFYDIDLFNKSDLYDRGSLCEIQFLLDIQGLGNPCPVLTISFEIKGDGLLSESSLKLPIYYTGNIDSEYSYQGRVGTLSILLQKNTFWELIIDSGVWATSSDLLGTYSNGLNISCQETEAYCIDIFQDGQLEEKLPGFQIRDLNGDLVAIFITGDGYILWDSSTNNWVFNIGCSFSVPGIQSEPPTGTFSDCGGGSEIVIKDIKDCLPEFGINPISGVISGVILFFETNDYQSQKTFTLNVPNGNSLQDWEIFYQQIIDAISNEEIFSDRDFIFDIYEPGNPNINPNMLPGYHVLSVKYESEICDIKVSATQPNPCQSLFEYFITQMVSSLTGKASVSLYENPTEITNILTQGFTLSKSDFNFCCPDCGPRQISFLATSDPPSTPYLNFIQNEFGCPISATSSNSITLSSYSTYGFTNSPEFLQTYSDLSSLSSFVNQFGIGEYGSPSLLSEVYQTLVGVSQSITDWNLLFKSLLEDGLVVGCDNDNYYVFNNTSYFQYIG